VANQPNGSGHRVTDLGGLDVDLDELDALLVARRTALLTTSA
jgi:hypothetical protein